jgi:hypothetical protein
MQLVIFGEAVAPMTLSVTFGADGAPTTLSACSDYSARQEGMPYRLDLAHNSKLRTPGHTAPCHQLLDGRQGRASNLLTAANRDGPASALTS